MIVSRTGRYRAIVISGFACLAIGCGCLSTITSRSPRAVMVVFMILTGCGGGQTLQTTTIAVQASVPRKDMSVVTAFRNFIRMLGGAFSLAVASSLINNSLRAAMKSLSLPESTISTVIDDPSLLSHPFNTTSLGITPTSAEYILAKGYNKGFRSVFILNACLAVVATLVSIMMIKHKELVRGDEEKLKLKALEELREKKKRGEKASRPASPVPGVEPVIGQMDVELGVMPQSDGIRAR
ncbi:mfs drug transporter [Moniliophthora roreri]|nr:mfs drug transporter [Moniliophthora roreri]